MAREINRLTKDKVRRLIEAGKSGGKPGRWNDGAGLYLQISKWGTGSWIYRYMIDGRPRHMGLGSVNEFSLPEARTRAAKVRREIKGDDDPTKPRTDPIEVRREARDRNRADARKAMTFKEALARYVEVHSFKWENPKYAKQAWNTTLRTYAHALFDRPVSAIDGALITETLTPIWNTKAVTARRVRQRIEAVVKWIGEGMPLPEQHKVEPVKAMDYDRVPAFMVELRKNESADARLLEFMILTGCRSLEAIDAEWTEFDLKNKIWTCPGERLENGQRVSGMKNKKDHKFALSNRAVEILEKMPRFENEPHVFIGKRGRLGKNAAYDLLRKMDPTADPHGLGFACRSSVENHASDAGTHGSRQGADRA